MTGILQGRHSERYGENLSYIGRTSPSLHDKLKGLSPPAFEEAFDGNPTIRVRGKLVESSRTPGLPKELPKRDIPASRGKKSLSLFLGSGLGYHLNGLAAEPEPKALLVERDLPLFDAALRIIEPKVLRKLILIVDEEEETAVEEVLSLRPFEGGGSIGLVLHPGSVRIHPLYYRSVEERLRSAGAESVASEMTSRSVEGLWVRNVIGNLGQRRSGPYPTTPLRGCCPGPFLLVSSGPFLEERIDLVRTLSLSMPTLALLPSLPYLLESGVRVDAVVSSDANFWNRLRLTASREASLPLFTTPSVDRSVYREWRGRVHLFLHGLVVERFLFRLAERCVTIPMQGTVSLVMILLARVLGGTALYLAGYDFGFDGMRDHHRGGGFESYLYGLADRLRTVHTLAFRRMRDAGSVDVRDERGGVMKTSVPLTLYRNWMEREIDRRGCLRVNRGLPIEGVPPLMPDDVPSFRGPGASKGLFRSALESASDQPIERERLLSDLRALSGFDAASGSSPLGPDRVRVRNLLNRSLRALEES